MKIVSLDSLPVHARSLAEHSLVWMEQYGDPKHHLLLYPGKSGHYAHFDASRDSVHLVRESVWWATGLLLRGKPEDLIQAHNILGAVLDHQFNEPGMPYHGTFRRAPEEAAPPGSKAVMWSEYDPNWRQFIGTAFLAILEYFPEKLSPGLIRRLDESIRLAVEGEGHGRVQAGYTNIAMMQAVLLTAAGNRYQQEGWKERGRTLAREIYDLFCEHRTFAEYNSPTYYGVVLYALRLWRLFSGDAQVESWGKEMETALWTQTGDSYHSSLRNICGPYDRAYGMDMTKYASVMGLWIHLGLPHEQAPLPPLSPETDHSHDYVQGPLIALLGADIPGEALAHFKGFRQPRSLHQTIENHPTLRTATARLEEKRMWGAESGPRGRFWEQYHGATAHWLEPDGRISWLRLHNEVHADAIATETGLTVTIPIQEKTGKLVWKIRASSCIPSNSTSWQFPGFKLSIETSLPAPVAGTEPDLFVLIYEVPASTAATLTLLFE